ncbi:hypothetical protein TREMEDRAFT_66452 [Tremella mesenterica DSM 1558]|uniref:uncharacterized protein n=1 Tax=Tremella mesenterica (strain ATCC 24925 / CBS 8224 / DSM 1558 / NBRC 9311 / NRRL Y-6157 / RJB 2259-6 / UBC 559-6) TaxID=578456 RepID=UPI00032BA31F|nr:uncharacterized protein TREMEDRAFT_66452 [Tremella mesenterica DSM 1558]EIW65540.1 hypothetical protein TREMEDRAFT_66452 [Tremella mesenterica DSM 1558]
MIVKTPEKCSDSPEFSQARVVTHTWAYSNFNRLIPFETVSDWAKGVVAEGEDELEEYSDDDMREVISVDNEEVDGPEPVPVSPPAQVEGQKRPRSLSSSSSSSSSGVLSPVNAIAAAAAANTARPVANAASL